MGLLLENLSRAVNGEIYLDNITLHLKPGSRHTILGRTLAGKTSLLRILAGLDRPDTGKLSENGVNITGLSVKKRNISMVYQQFINYPSYTVFENIAAPLINSGIQKNLIREKVQETAELLHIEHLLERLPSELSGGQQQRTAIARALVKEADLLLLDEPLVNLDYKLREELRMELREIFRKRDCIVVYTTTEPSEALMFGGNIVVMDKGRIVQVGDTAQVYRNPSNVDVAEIFNDPPINTVPAVLNKDKVTMGTTSFTPKDNLKKLPEGNYLFGIRAAHISKKKVNGEDVKLAGNVVLSEISGSETFIHAETSGQNLVVQEDGVHNQSLGERIDLYMSSENFLVFEPGGKLVSSP